MSANWCHWAYHEIEMPRRNENWFWNFYFLFYNSRLFLSKLKLWPRLILCDPNVDCNPTEESPGYSWNHRLFFWFQKFHFERASIFENFVESRVKIFPYFLLQIKHSFKNDHFYGKNGIKRSINRISSLSDVSAYQKMDFWTSWPWLTYRLPDVDWKSGSVEDRSYLEIFIQIWFQTAFMVINFINSQRLCPGVILTAITGWFESYKIEIFIVIS